MDAFADAAARAAGKSTDPPALIDVLPGGDLEVRHPADEARMPTVIDPRTGEVYDSPADLPSDRLAELAYRLRQAETERRLWRRAVEEELRARLEADGRREAVVGDYQLAVTSGKRREWDAGVLQAGEVAELLTREVKVNGTLARQLLERLTGASHDVLASCFTWVQRGPKVTIEPVAEQLPPGQGHA